MKLVAYAALLLLSSTSIQAAPIGYPILCRGPLTVSFAGADILIDFNKSTVAAGVTGESLKAGECAWAERATSGNEPMRIYFDVEPVVANTASAGSGSINELFERMAERQLLDSALLNSNVVVQIYVYNDGRYFKNQTGRGSGRAFTIYPAKDVATAKPVQRVVN